MEELIEKFYLGYNWEEDFLELSTDINDVEFLIECWYDNRSYHRKEKIMINEVEF